MRGPATGRRLRAVRSDLARQRHVVVKVAAAEVCDQQATLRVLRQRVRCVELTGTAPPRTDRFDELAFAREEHQARIPVTVRHDDVAVVLHDHCRGSVEMAAIVAPFAERTEFQQQGAVGPVFPHGVTIAVRRPEHAVLLDVQRVRAEREAAFVGGAPLAEIAAAAIEHRDAALAHLVFHRKRMCRPMLDVAREQIDDAFCVYCDAGAHLELHTGRIRWPLFHQSIAAARIVAVRLVDCVV